MIKHKLKLALWNAQGRACAICSRTLAEPRREGQGGGVEFGGLPLIAHRTCIGARGERPADARELQLLDAVYRALDPRTQKWVLAFCVDRCDYHRTAAREAKRRASEADQSLMAVLRYVSSADAARAIARLGA